MLFLVSSLLLSTAGHALSPKKLVIPIWSANNHRSLRQTRPTASVFANSLDPRVRHPWLVVFGRCDGDDCLQVLCGGSLVHERYVLTANHCTCKMTYDANGDLAKEPGNAEDYPKLTCTDGYWNKHTVLLGRHDLNVPMPDEQVIRCARILHSPDDYDIALCELEHPANLSNVIKTIPLSLTDPGALATVTATGWRMCSADSEFGIAKTVSLQVSARTEYTHTVHCCYSYGNVTTVLCTGDSGSPLISTGLLDQRVIGVTSTIEESNVGACRRFTVLSVSIAQNKAWINSILNNVPG